MYQSILVGIDFSDTSVETVRWAVSRFPEAEIALFHSIEPLGVPGYLVREFGSKLDIVRERDLDARANLEEIARQCGIEARIEVRAGWPPEALAAVSEEIRAQLVVVGAHQKRMWQSDELGNTCVAIVRKATVPVLVWRPIRQERDKTILAALDLRDGSAPIAATAARYAAYFDARLLLLHAMPGTLQAYLRAVSSPTKVEETLRRIEQRARAEALDRIPEDLREQLDTQVSIVRGRPIVNHILTTAEAEAVDLIVIGKYHAPAFTERVLLGGITRQVIQGANCSVLTVPV
ncbi:MAG: universal stress protein [Candidatus Palauibacterales bacterium]|nr:universal stress protein [Candidatus Palauibacterales bacterium]MDP2483799.1 universal stress protein [Candidatus Palauibacterales bacterium]